MTSEGGPAGAGAEAGGVAPALADRLDELQAGIADLTFRVETLVGSTASFRAGLSDRLTDYADLVARWSIETEENLDSARRAAERSIADARRTAAEALEASRAASEVGREVEVALARTEEVLASHLGSARAEAGERFELLLDRLDEQRGEARALAASVEAAVAALGTGVAALTEQLAGLPAVLDRQGRELRDAVDSRLRELPAALERAVVESLERRVAPVAADVATAGERLADLDRSVQELAGRVSDLGAVAERLTQGQAEVSAALSAAPDLADTIEPLASEVHLLRQGLRTQPDPQALLHRMVVELEVATERLEQVAQRTPPGVEQLLERLEAVAAQVDAPAAAARMGELTDQVARLREGLASLAADEGELRDAVAEALAPLRGALGPERASAEVHLVDEGLAGEIVDLLADVAARLDAPPPVPAEVMSLARQVEQLRSEVGDAVLEEVSALREEVAAVRSARVEDAGSRNLSRLAAEVRALREALEAEEPAPPEWEVELAELRTEVRQLRAGPEGDLLAALVEGVRQQGESLTRLAEEVRILRRRIPVRARPAEGEPAAGGPPEAAKGARGTATGRRVR